MFIELLNLLEHCTDCIEASKSLIKNTLECFRYHPYIFMLRHSPPQKDAISPFTHQVELLYKLFFRKPLRVLIGDEIGLGKTIEAILLLKYLQEVNEAKRVLILVPRVLVNQWESELKRFNIHPKHIERSNIDVLRQLSFPEGVYLASIDLVKRDEYKNTVYMVQWDLVIVDEAHRVGLVGGRKNERYIFLEGLLNKNPEAHLILLSATPHRGKPDDYINRLKLLDPYLTATLSELDREEFYMRVNGALVFRRSKLDVNEIYEQSDVFKPCEFIAYVVEANEKEKKFHELLIEFLRDKLQEYYSLAGKKPKVLPLLFVIVAKRASSSPQAALLTFERILLRRSKGLRYEDLEKLEERVEKLISSLFTGFEEYGEIIDETLNGAISDQDDVVDKITSTLAPLISEADIVVLKELLNLAREVATSDSRLREVIKLIKEHLSRGDKIVIFTEFKDTADYVYRSLLTELPPGHREKVCLVSASEIRPPQLLGEKVHIKYSIENVKEWLKSGIIDVIVSTDVASEGLNLQYANVVIHYEPSWSPIKIVQRIGRVWRVGQEKSVYSYNVLLAVESDLAVFQNLYAKLLSWFIAGVTSEIVLGEKLRISLLPREKPKYVADVMVMPISVKEERGFSEFEAILKFIKGGKEALREYIDQILTMLENLKNISRKIRSEKGEKRITVDKVILEGLGGLCRLSAIEVLKKILLTLTYMENCEVERGEKIKISCPRGLIFIVENSADIYKSINVIVEGSRVERPLVLIASLSKADLRELHLFEVVVKSNMRPVYSEIVGVIVSGEKPSIIRGVKLLELLSNVINNIIGVATSIVFGSDGDTVIRDLSIHVKSVILNFYKKRAVTLLKEYLDFVERSGLSSKHESWDLSVKSINVETSWVGSIVFITPVSEQEESPLPIAIKEVEERAMKFVIEYERQSGRVPRDVHLREHYDIESYDPKTSEIRYIEVKGRWGLNPIVELTEEEFKYASKLGKNYWLYVVYNISSGNPKLIAIQDPVNTVSWRVLTKRRYILGGSS